MTNEVSREEIRDLQGNTHDLKYRIEKLEDRQQKIRHLIGELASTLLYTDGDTQTEEWSETLRRIIYTTRTPDLLEPEIEEDEEL